MDYDDFIDGLFADQPSILALRLCQVSLAGAAPAESGSIWFLRDEDTAVCAAAGLARPFAGRVAALAREIADGHAQSGLKLVGRRCGASELRQGGQCSPRLADRARTCLLPIRDFLLAADLEDTAPAGEEGAEIGDAPVSVRILMAGLPLDGAFERSVWIAAFCRDTADPLDEATLFRYLALAHPLRLHGTPYDQWGREPGDGYWTGLPRLRAGFLGALQPDAPRTGEPQRNLFWGKGRNSLLPAWKQVCRSGVDDLVAEVRRRLTELDDRIGGRIGAGRLIGWIEAKGRGAADAELDCALVLCAGATLAGTNRLWLPLLCVLWQRTGMEKARDLDATVAAVLGAEVREPWRKYVPVGHAGYAMQAVVDLREALSRCAGGLVSQSVRYLAPEGKVEHLFDISGIDPAGARALVEGVASLEGSGGGARGGFLVPRGALPSAALGKALRDLKDDKRGAIGEMTAAFVSERSALRVAIRFPVASLR